MPPSEEMRVKVCLVGEGSVGKTCLIRRYVYDEFDDRYVSTIGAKVSKKDAVIRDADGGRVTVSMAIWDIMGQPTFRDIMKEAFFYGTAGALAVCDLTADKTLYEMSGWVDAVQRVAGDIPIHFLANKADLMEKRSFDEGQLAQVAAKYHAPYNFTSAKTGENVQDAFEKLARAIAG